MEDNRFIRSNELSKRLGMVASLVTPGQRVADIGTDHGYVPIFLVEQGIAPSAIAMDINEGPLLRAEENIRKADLAEQIKTRRSDGIAKLSPNEVDCMIAAGMGGGLVIHIVEDGDPRGKGIKEMILQPQSEIRKVREYLLDHGFRIDAERMTVDEGIYYTAMKVTDGRENDAYDEEELNYGRDLIRRKDPVLLEYLRREEARLCPLLEALLDRNGEHIEARKRELGSEIAQIRSICGKLEA